MLFQHAETCGQSGVRSRELERGCDWVMHGGVNCRSERIRAAWNVILDYHVFCARRWTLPFQLGTPVTLKLS